MERERDQPFPGPHPENRNRPYQFNQDEMRVLRECNKESFFQRCLPLSGLLGGGIYYAIKAGSLKGHPKYGAIPKVTLGVVVGYFVGKFSYQRKCAEKLMLLPNSPVGEMLRQRRKGGLTESLEPGFGPGMSLAPFSGMTASDTYSDVPPRNSLDLDTTRPEMDELDDAHRPTLDNPIYVEEMPPMQQSKTTYEELRKQNREEYQQKRIGNFKDSSSSQRPSSPIKRDTDSPKTQTNKYGDPWG